MSARERLSRCGSVEAGADGALGIVFDNGRPEQAHDAGRAACAGNGCGACPGAVRPRRLRLDRAGSVMAGGTLLAPGDRVELSVDAAGLVRAAAWAFGIPVAGLLAGAWLGSQAGGEGASIALAAFGLAGGLAWFGRRSAGLVAELGLRADTWPAAGAPGGAEKMLPGDRRVKLRSEVRS